MIANLTGASNQSPGPYQSVGVLSAPYQGLGVDGCVALDHLNGNTVTANIVTEATGAHIDSTQAACAGGVTAKVVDSLGPIGFLSEGARTQYLGVTAAPATQTTASLGTGTYTLGNLLGAGSALASGGTATITGAASATAGSPNTFTVTVAGTVTVTVTAPLTQFDLQNGAFQGSYIPNTGAAGTSVTKNATTLTYASAGNLNASQMSICLEQSWNHAPSGTGYTFGTYVDANNSTSLFHDGTNLVGRLRVAGVNYDATLALSYAAYTLYKPSMSWGPSGVKCFAGGAMSAVVAQGPELVTNGNFAVDANWTKTTGKVTISSGAGLTIANGTAGVDYASQASVFTVGVPTRITYMLTGVTGQFSVQAGNTAGTTRTSAGTYTEMITATSSGSLYLIPVSGSGNTATFTLVSAATSGNTYTGPAQVAATFQVGSAGDGTGQPYAHIRAPVNGEGLYQRQLSDARMKQLST